MICIKTQNGQYQVSDPNSLQTLIKADGAVVQVATVIFTGNIETVNSSLENSKNALASIQEDIDKYTSIVESINTLNSIQ